MGGELLHLVLWWGVGVRSRKEGKLREGKFADVSKQRNGRNGQSSCVSQVSRIELHWTCRCVDATSSSN